MTTKAGVGFSDNAKSSAAGAEAARAAMAEAGVGECELALMYASPKHDPTELRDAVRGVIGRDTRLIGGASMGVITKDRLGYEGYETGVAVISSDQMRVDMFMESGLPDNEYNVGLALGEQIKGSNPGDDANILIMYDSVKERTSEGAALNHATPLLKGMGEALGSWPQAAGAGLFPDLQWNPLFQWFDDRIEQGVAMALVLSGGVRMDSIIMHGCVPSGDYHEVTKAEGPVILEIDGEPALERVDELLGHEGEESWQKYPLFVTLGTNLGDKFGEFREEYYVNRLCMAIDRERKGLVMFEPDLQAGSEVQLMRRSVDSAYVRERSEKLLVEVGDRKPFLALYIDCGGRVSAITQSEQEEAEEVQDVIGSRMPLLGLYSGVEIAKVRGQMQPLDWTGVLCIFSE